MMTGLQQCNNVNICIVFGFSFSPQGLTIWYSLCLEHAVNSGSLITPFLFNHFIWLALIYPSGLRLHVNYMLVSQS